MSLLHQTNRVCFISSRSEAVKSNPEPGLIKKADPIISLYENGSTERIKKMFKETALSVSSYDTAWMAMVPCSGNQTTPQFPSCLNWVLNNQLSDGSWGLCDRDTTLTMEALSSTLACVVALKQWGTGERQINMGLEFIGLNSAVVSDDKQRKPIGFDIIFPGMIEQANSLNLHVPVRGADLDALFKKRNLELASSSVDFPEGRRAYLSYISEGLGIYQDWEMAMKYQKNNGSLFNSPSATAAAYSHLRNADNLNYLNLLLDKCGDAAPAVYDPLGIYNRLWIVDNLERLGIQHHFEEEIQAVLEETYRYWVQGEEEVFEDTTTCAMAFRLLRLHGYGVDSDELRRFCSEDRFRCTLEGYLAKAVPVLELYKASQVSVYEDELILEEINSWTNSFLRDWEGIADQHLSKEVDHALRFPYHVDLERLANRRNIENYKKLETLIMLKSAVCSSAIGNKDFLNLAVENFNTYQLIHREEMKDIERWVVEKRLDKLKFARQKQVYCYFNAIAMMPNPKQSDARVTFTKNCLLATVMDDFFDVGGTEEELENVIQLLMNKYCGDSGDSIVIEEEGCTENVKILYSALDSTIVEMVDKAFTWQRRCVTDHTTQTWLGLLKAFQQEADWTRKKSVPTMAEYLANGLVSFALEPIVVLTLYFMGPQLCKDAVQSPQLQRLFELMSTCGRLLNDVQTFKRESKEGKLNAVTLHMIHNGVTEEESIKKMKGLIRSKARQLLRSCILEEEDNSANLVPRACKDLFWKMNTTLYFFYAEEDGYTASNLFDDAKLLLHQPIDIE